MASNILRLAPSWLSSMFLPFLIFLSICYISEFKKKIIYIYIKFSPWYQQQSITVWSSVHGTRCSFHFVHNYLHILCTILHPQHQNVINILQSKVTVSKIFRMPLSKNKTNLLSYPNSPVFLIWWNSCTHPNIMHFPSPENQHAAQQTDKYLIGQPSVPSPIAATTMGMRVSHNPSAMSSFGNQSPCGDKVRPAHLWMPLRLVLAVPVWLATARHRCQGITDE